MRILINDKGIKYEVDLSKPIDISIELIPGQHGPNCFYAPLFNSVPFRSGDFIGSTLAGAPVNFMNVSINPHGNGTHTECVGHISSEKVTINEVLRDFHFIIKLVSLYPGKLDNGDRAISLIQVKEVFNHHEARGIVIRTLPNHEDKKQMNYSGTNPPFIESDALEYLVNNGIEHLLVDLPSVDREEDGGKLAGHKSFWQYPETLNKNRTISELVYIPNEVKDGLYLMNLQIASFGIDVSPSKPLLYKLEEI